MMRYSLIIALLLFNSFINLLAYSEEEISAKGLYFVPKFYYSHDANNTYVNEDGSIGYYNYVGGGLSVGYGLPTKNKVSPFRLEIEYAFTHAVGTSNNVNMHNIFTTFYYDINFLFTDDLLIDDELSKQILQTTYPLFSLFFGVSVGANITTSYDAVILGDLELNLSRYSFAFAFTGGFSYYILPWLNMDIAYRFLIDVAPRWHHELLFGLRFTIPDY